MPVTNRYAQRASDAVLAYLQPNLPTYLRQVETEQGLAANTLTNPRKYVGSPAPSDNTSPMIHVFMKGGKAIPPNRSRYTETDVAIAVTWTGTSDLTAGEEFMNRYLTALLLCLEADHSLGARVEVSFWTDFERAFLQIDQTAIKHARTVSLTVRTFDPF